MLVSRPLAEKRQMSAAASPVAAGQGHGVFGERAGIIGGGEDAEGGDVEVDVGVRKGDARGGGIDNDDVFAGGGWRSGGERDNFVRSIRGDYGEGNAVGRGGVWIADLDGEIAGDGDIGGG